MAEYASSLARRLSGYQIRFRRSNSWQCFPQRTPGSSESWRSEVRPHSHASPVLLARGQEVLLPYKNISLAYAIVFQKSRSDVSLSSCATMKIPSREGKEGLSGFLPSGTTHPYSPEAVKKLRTGGNWEGEAPAEPHRARTCWGDGSPGSSPSQFFHSFPPAEGKHFDPSWCPFSCLWRRQGRHGWLL